MQFAEVPAAPVEEQLIGVAEENRFAAEVDGSDPGIAPGGLRRLSADAVHSEA
jgi:hypothetical protein